MNKIIYVLLVILVINISCALSLLYSKHQDEKDMEIKRLKTELDECSRNKK